MKEILLPSSDVHVFSQAIRQIVDRDGSVLGRASLFPAQVIDGQASKGVVASKGATVCYGAFRGIMLGSPVRAARDYAALSADSKLLSAWATEQACVLSAFIDDDNQQIKIAQHVAALAGDVGNLKICEVGGRHFSLFELTELLKKVKGILVVQDAAVSIAKRDSSYERSNEVISVAMGVPWLLETSRWAFDSYYRHHHTVGFSLDDPVVKLIGAEFNIDADLMKRYLKIEDGHSVYEGEAPAWWRKTGEIVSVRGRYFCRNMSAAIINRFFVPAGRRKENLW